MTSTKNNLDGWLVIDKPKGISSAGVIGKLKFLLHPQKIGHAGTLDPLATGVLPVALGKATRLIPFVMEDIKTYEFEIKWGIETDSDDLAGTEISTHQKRPSKEEILNILPQFTGKITQIPSSYSAIKINGKRAYELARNGLTVEMPKRTVSIYKLELIKNSIEKTSFTASVSKGTYIRTLAHDIAHALGTVGVVSKLHRIQDGPFSIKQAVTLESDLKILPLECVLGNLKKLEVSAEIAERVKHGQRIKDKNLATKTEQEVPLSIWYNKKLIAIMHLKEDVLHPDCVFI